MIFRVGLGGGDTLLQVCVSALRATLCAGGVGDSPSLLSTHWDWGLIGQKVERFARLEDLVWRFELEMFPEVSVSEDLDLKAAGFGDLSHQRWRDYEGPRGPGLTKEIELWIYNWVEQEGLGPA